MRRSRRSKIDTRRQKTEFSRYGDARTPSIRTTEKRCRSFGKTRAPGPVRPGGAFLLCADGFREAVREDELIDALFPRAGESIPDGVHRAGGRIGPGQPPRRGDLCERERATSSGRTVSVAVADGTRPPEPPTPFAFGRIGPDIGRNRHTCRRHRPQSPCRAGRGNDRDSWTRLRSSS